jgi:hypothetical protein
MGDDKFVGHSGKSKKVLRCNLEAVGQASPISIFYSRGRENIRGITN